MSQPKPFKKVPTGTILAVTHGSYSDYELVGLFRVLKSFDFNQEFAEDLFRDEKGDIDYTVIYTSGRLSQMEKAGLVEEIPYMELQTEGTCRFGNEDDFEHYELSLPVKWWKD